MMARMAQSQALPTLQSPQGISSEAVLCLFLSLSLSELWRKPIGTAFGNRLSRGVFRLSRAYTACSALFPRTVTLSMD